MKIKNIKHIFFDLDHTLWDFDKNSALTFKKIFDIHNIALNLELFLEIYESINQNYWKLYREDEIDQTALRYDRLKDSFNVVKYGINDELINQISEDYLLHLTTFNHLFDDTIETLNYLKTKYRLHIITNGFEKAQRKKIETSQLATYFDTVTNSEMAGVKKPNPIIFNHALQLADAKPHESIMIGDSLEADVFGALNAKIDAIFFNYRNTKTDKEVKQVQNLSKLKIYL